MNQIPLIGRVAEQKILQEALQSKQPEMISVIGRRRVGKTFLINTTYKKNLDFEITGIQYASRKEQLKNFMIRFVLFFKPKATIDEPKDWIDAFHLLTQFLDKKRKTKKKVIFFDELPWLSSHKSGFLKGFSYFWNSWAIHQNIVVVICGSAASWMIQKVVHHKGGLHNRITRHIYLQPFTLSETSLYFKAKKINLDYYQILHLYMAMGGVPHYLNEVKGKLSAVQNVDNICFSANGLLYDEFSKLFGALFSNSENHIKVVRALARKTVGLTRSEIIKLSKLPDGGGLSKVLEELEQAGFIQKYYPFNKVKKNRLYRLSDEYSLFYIRFIEKNKTKGKSSWQQLSQTQSYKSWSGYAFESICLKHIDQVKTALGINGIYSHSSSYYKKGNDRNQGLQIDLLIDRNDHVINLCEIKFYQANVKVTKAMEKKLRERMRDFQLNTKTHKHLSLVLITTFGLEHTGQGQDLFADVVTLKDLFVAM